MMDISVRARAEDRWRELWREAEAERLLKQVDAARDREGPRGLPGRRRARVGGVPDLSGLSAVLRRIVETLARRAPAPVAVPIRRA